MNSIDPPENKTSSLAYIQQQDRKKKSVTVTTCPPGCGNGTCQKVFVDSLGFGFQVKCECKKCHGGRTGEEEMT